MWEGIVFALSDKHRGNSCGGAVFLQESPGAPGRRLAKHRKQSVAAGIEKALFFCTVSGTFSFGKTKENVGDMASGWTTLPLKRPVLGGRSNYRFVIPPLSSRIRFAGLWDELGDGDCVGMDYARSLFTPFSLEIRFAGFSRGFGTMLVLCRSSASGCYVGGYRFCPLG